MIRHRLGGLNKMIQYISPFAIDKNIGNSYNATISLLPDGWICLRDYDTLLFPNSCNHIAEIIESNPEYELFTSMTNRVGVSLHCVPGMFNNDSVLDHQNKSVELWETHGSRVIETGVAPGFCMIFKKELWQRVGGFAENSIFFDRDFSNKSKKSGARIGLSLGLYIYHLYRYPHSDAKNHIQHLLK